MEDDIAVDNYVKKRRCTATKARIDGERKNKVIRR